VPAALHTLPATRFLAICQAWHDLRAVVPHSGLNAPIISVAIPGDMAWVEGGLLHPTPPTTGMPTPLRPSRQHHYHLPLLHYPIPCRAYRFAGHSGSVLLFGGLRYRRHRVRDHLPASDPTFRFISASITMLSSAATRVYAAHATRLLDVDVARVARSADARATVADARPRQTPHRTWFVSDAHRAWLPFRATFTTGARFLDVQATLCAGVCLHTNAIGYQRHGSRRRWPHIAPPFPPLPTTFPHLLGYAMRHSRFGLLFTAPCHRTTAGCWTLYHTTTHSLPPVRHDVGAFNVRRLPQVRV